MSQCPPGYHCPASLLVADLQQTSQVNLRSLPSGPALVTFVFKVFLIGADLLKVCKRLGGPQEILGFKSGPQKFSHRSATCVLQ